ncbi:tRNA (guanosine(46)-N7)-methyltransferase TrmB [Anaerococcus sp. AGMB00486]|uniref:tRNA (guanine-N(7)-)-methyltransferase n=2 Tax=Anaerococcus TaxID=165779 RepID=A0ABX2N858_9FIRM|nr:MULTISPECIES: tRNA (guanosine(46)-N7)-methyltransferase TrmB [Anaerococcus]MDY3005428.1 tRNA (guanosine(46)-N7)-methyltransferase TrmB [Anaerococcus porci]MSS77335.1 tRNA (guanosine(46)-N7)-methyltransferase TrmB [Anaerococcus porci]NVF10863.1 tRNA (guanosine(46)-N7)-methyltransferase TrmB [Anaerococcus faecalis]
MRLRFKENAIPEMKENPQIFFGGEDKKGKWHEEFNNKEEIHLEIGAGRGDFISQIAFNNKNTNFIALEVNTNAFVVASRKIKENELRNVRGLIADAEDLEKIFEKNEIDKIYLNFSTPWPKTRHHKRRLSHKRFLDRYKNIVKDKAVIELKTDNEDFFLASIKYFEDFSMTILEVDRDLSEEKSIYISEYERKFRDKDMPIFYVKARFNL